ncbi:hypothetical protein CYMTET_51526 [Cymbomonas tetramitiformis]|uniref:Uncharacterized protein n=1 Tax=Cymbomonas tetramitiformis TaxID=36881 RepID=A0AAE0ES91_9CHLO|nr:hypothetical protein CYMTET_51526 [Cymbomonas tetramitiformis]
MPRCVVVPLHGKASIHDYASEYENIKALAQLDLVHLAQPCVAGCEAETGLRCRDCAPGSTCACGDNLPTPLSLPGFCHMKGNYTCFYKCPNTKMCPGGPKSSRCYKSFDPHEQGLECTAPGDVPQELSINPPLWARASWDPLVLKEVDRAANEAAKESAKESSS